MNTSHTIAASDARNNFSDLISKVQYQGNIYLIERYGEVVAKLVPAFLHDETTPGELADQVANQGKPKTEIDQTMTARTQTPLTSSGAESSAGSSARSQISAAESTVSTTPFARPPVGSYRQVTPMGRTVNVGAMTAEKLATSVSANLETAQDHDVMQNKQANAGSDLSDEQYAPSLSTATKQFQTSGESPAEAISSADTSKEAESGWSALRKLEELIAAQKRKNEQAARETQKQVSTPPTQTSQEFSDRKSNPTAWDQPAVKPTTGPVTSSTSDSTSSDYTNWPNRPPFFQSERKSEEMPGWSNQSTQPVQPAQSEKVDVIRKRIDL